MFMARRKPSLLLTLQRRYDFHIGEAIRASLAGDYDKTLAHSGTALSIGRELYRQADEHRPELAAALACHARGSAAYGRIGDALALLTESAGHYAVLAAADPEAYEVRRIDVLTRVALASDAAGNTGDSIALLREVIEMYADAPTTAGTERDFGRARARFYLGGCLLKTGNTGAALTEFDAGLTDAERAWARLRETPPGGAGESWHAGEPGPGRAGELGYAGEPEYADDAEYAGRPEYADEAEYTADAGEPFGEFGDAEGAWLATAPRVVQLTAPDWAAAAVRAMALHASARHWHSAARAARIAVRLSAGLAALGGDDQRENHAAIRARADAIWAQERLQRTAAKESA